MPFTDLPEDVLRHVLTCATPKELLQTSTTSTHNRRAALDEHIWLPLCRARWGLSESTPVDTRAPAYELYPLARPPPSLRCGFRAATKLRCSRTSSGLIEVSFEGELGVGDRSAVADVAFFGDDYDAPAPRSSEHADRSSRSLLRRARTFLSGSPPAVSGDGPPPPPPLRLAPPRLMAPRSPVAAARAFLAAHRRPRTPSPTSDRKGRLEAAVTPRVVCDTFPFVDTRLAADPSLVAYFELRVTMTGAPRPGPGREAAAPPCVAIGLSARGFAADHLMPGWDGDSWGYHGDDGGRFHGDGAAVSSHEPFGHGDVVGCSVDRASGSVFFTKNGAYLGATPLSRDHLRGPLYPTVGLDHGDAVHVNFGAEPFAYDLGAHAAADAARAALRAALRRQSPRLLSVGF